LEVIRLPAWLSNLRKTEIIERVRNDPRSRNGTLFGMSPEGAFNAIDGGKTDFTKPRGNLSTDDMAVLYAYLNQKGHLEELIAAFGQLFAERSPKNPVIVDLGSGPFTGGLALASTFCGKFCFDYIGVDRAPSMRRFGEYLASSESVPGQIKRQWVSDITEVNWESPPGWRDIIVIVSYLFASPTLDVESLFDSLERLLIRIGRGRVMLLYTNATADTQNVQYKLFRNKLIEAEFSLEAEDHGQIFIKRAHGVQVRNLRYALFYRNRQRRLQLGK